MSETINALKKTTLNDRIGLILITENMAEQCLDSITQLRSNTGKAIIIIPTHQGSRHTSVRELNKEIARAVGMDIFANE